MAFKLLPLKAPRYGVDAWDEMMMDRDTRMTGHARVQTVRLAELEFIVGVSSSCTQSEPIAPEGFDTSSVWYTERA